MRLSDPAALPWIDGVPHRATSINLKMLLERDGIQFTLSEVCDPTTRSPRHRHNFDQVRIGLEGVATYGRGRDIRERTIGYFPEGTRYGPQGVSKVPSTQAVLQFEGASRSRYIAADVINQSTAALRQAGHFRDGLYVADGERRGVDAFQAVWEHAVGHPMAYPPPRYEDPVYLHVDAFSYLSSESPGVARKLLGVFGERELSIRMTRLTGDAEVAIGDGRQRCVYFVLTGSVRLASDVLGRWSTVYTDPGDRATVSGACGEAELVEVALPIVPDATPAERRSVAVAAGVGHGHAVRSARQVTGVGRGRR